MGNLMTRLERQLQIPEHKKDAEDCIKIYNWLKEIDGQVWNIRWSPLVDVKFKGFPSDYRTYKLNIIGRTLLKGISR